MRSFLKGQGCIITKLTNSKGVAIIEFAFIIPVLMLLIYFIYDFSKAYMYRGKIKATSSMSGQIAKCMINKDGYLKKEDAVHIVNAIGNIFSSNVSSEVKMDKQIKVSFHFYKRSETENVPFKNFAFSVLGNNGKAVESQIGNLSTNEIGNYGVGIDGNETKSKYMLFIKLEAGGDNNFFNKYTRILSLPNYVTDITVIPLTETQFNDSTASL